MTQQVISYNEVPSCTAGPARSDHPTSSNGTVPPSSPRSWTSTLSNGDMQPLMKAAVYSSLFGNSSIGSSSSCSPGRSTYPSLGVCASCEGNRQIPFVDLKDSSRWGNGPCFQEGDVLTMDANIPLKDLEIVNASYVVIDGEYPRAGECALSWCLRTFPICVDEDPIVNILYHQSNDSYTLMPTNTSIGHFYVDVRSSNKISNWTRSLLTGRLRDENWHGPERTYRGKMPKYPDDLYSRSESPCPDLKSSDAISALGNFSSGTIKDKFQYMAAVMTEQIHITRRPDENMTSTGNGHASSNSCQTPTNNETQPREPGECHPVIHVQWGWLALPTSLVILAPILQLVTMVRTNRRDTPVWKSSTLALVFHGREVQEGLAHHLAPPRGSGIPDDMAGMEDVAAGIKVRLEYTGRGGWCLRPERPRLG